MVRFEQDRDLIRRRWFRMFRRLKKYYYLDGDWLQNILQPGRLRKTNPSWKWIANPSRLDKRIWSRKMRMDYKVAVLRCRDISEFYFSYNHRHWGWYEWL